MEWREATSEWSGYSERGHYTHGDLAAKADFVTAVVSDTPPGTV